MASDSRTHTPTLDNDDLETILSIARNEQSGRITRREAEVLVAGYRAHDGLVEALRHIADLDADADEQLARECKVSGTARSMKTIARRALEAAGIKTEADRG